MTNCNACVVVHVLRYCTLPTLYFNVVLQALKSCPHSLSIDNRCPFGFKCVLWCVFSVIGWTACMIK